ncbi:MAG: hypothetical protein HYT08_01455 [Candidatus Levybacteria bacterium]|nr:hypothetical protein [Candidatus Levybacteria bacterium]
MKKLLKGNRDLFLFIFILFVIWKLVLYVVEYFSKYIILNPQFTGLIPWANFDGEHYLNIAKYGYGIYQQAFFPLFPLLIKFFSLFFMGNYILSALFIVHVSLLISLIFLYKLASMDFKTDTVKWTLIFLLFFPTAFFLGSIYTESLFLAFVFSSFYFMRRQKFTLTSILIGFASATRIIGIFLLIPLLLEFYLSRIKNVSNLKSYLLNFLSFTLISSSGVLAYMIYLWVNYQDSFLFIHTQPAFGAERSGGEIILLPQLFFRYVKILTTLNPLTHNYLIALLEIIIFSAFLLLLMLFRKNIRFSYVLFSLFAIIVPTFSGTLSSMPRYTLVVFPIFILLARIKKTVYKLLLLTILSILLIILTSFFLRGYFIA